MEHYYSVNRYLRETYGEKLYKIALDGGFSCPNRDGTVGSGGCIFCKEGSGTFAVSVGSSIDEAIIRAAAKVKTKSASERYIAYFQSYTGTYAPVSYLRSLYSSVISHPQVAVLSIATRPDCLSDEVIELLQELNSQKPVWVELGLQSIHSATAKLIRRGYELQVFNRAVRALKNAGLYVIVHMILGLPGETENMMIDTARYIGGSGSDGIKFQLLHVLQGTVLSEMYRNGLFQVMDEQTYIRVLEKCIRNIPPCMVVHRITGDGAKADLIAPLWSADKKKVLNDLNSTFERDHLIQGSDL